MNKTTPDIINLTEQYVMHTYARLPVAFVKGEGCYLWDAEGKKYLDLVAGIAVNGLGHSHPVIADVISQQAKTLIHTSNLYYVKSQAELAELLCKNSFADKLFFCNSGTEANEAAAKLARAYGKKNKGSGCYEIISMENSFHGRTLAMVAATGQEKVQQGFDPLPEGFRQVPLNDLKALERAMGPKTCGVMLEPIQGEGGVQLTAPGYLQAVRELCDKKQVLLILDEIQTGLGRTGKLFAYEHAEIEPDILTLAKSLGTGLPIGACLARDSVAEAFWRGSHASTFGGNFLVCEVAKKFLHILLDEGILDQVPVLGNYFHERLKKLQSKFSFIREIRGEGLLLGVELSIPGRPLVEEGLKKGLLINCVQEKILRFLPPLIIQKSQIDEGVAILEDIFSEVN